MQSIGQLLTQALEQRSQQDLTLSPTGLTKNLQTAINSKPISLCDNYDVQKKLAYCMMLVGIKAGNIPQQEDAGFLIGQIVKNFGGNRLNEIQLAFDLAVSGQLDIEEKEINAYQDFTFMYFSRIFNSYRRWAAAEFKQIKEQPVQKIYTPEQLLDIQRADIEAFYQRCRNGVIPPNELPEYFKDVLVHDKLISEDSNDLHAFFSWHLNNGSENIYLKW